MACLADCIVCTCVLVLCVLRVVGFHTGSTIDQSCHELQMHWCREHAVRPCTFQCLCPSNTFSIRFTLRALLPVSASRQRSGTGLQAFCPSTFYEHGSLSLPSIATSQFLVYSTPSTFTLARIQIGTAHFTSRNGPSASKEPLQPCQTWSHVYLDHLPSHLNLLTSFFLSSEDGTLMQSVFLDSLPSNALLFARNMTTVLLISMKSVRCSTTTGAHSST